MSIPSGYRAIPNPEIAAAPTLLLEAQTQTNGADTTHVELRHGRGGFSVAMRTDDAVNRQSEWFGVSAHGFSVEGAADDYAERGGHRRDALAAARTQIDDDVEHRFVRRPNSDLTAFPELLLTEQTHTNGATTSSVELRRGGFGYLVILRTIDWTAQEIEWHNGRRYAEHEEPTALEDYAGRGGDRIRATTTLDGLRRVAAVNSCGRCGLRRRETELYAVNGGVNHIYGSLVELNSRDDGELPVAYTLACADCLESLGLLGLDPGLDPGKLRIERAAVGALAAPGDPVRYWGFVVVPGSSGRAILHYHGQSNWGVVRLSLSGYRGATTDAALLDWLTREAARPTGEYGASETPRFFDPATADGRFGLTAALRAAHEGQESISLEALARIV